MTAGPRIYNLFPLLAGSIDRWPAHLPRVAGMNFDWLYLNPVHEPGFSGSLYAIKDHWKLNPLIQGDSTEPADALIRRFCDQAREHGLKVMFDLVVGQTSKDSVVTGWHPGWYRRDANGELVSPRAPGNGGDGGTVWGDLAAFAWDDPSARPGLLRYFTDYVWHHVGLGVKGFRCDAAYQIPAEVWRTLIDAARERDPEVRFFAETLGCTPEQVEALCDAGFDYLFNSAKWWDFRADWLLDQYERYRRIAPTIAFPESHDTERLAAELGSQDRRRLETHLKSRYLFSASFSTGVMMPVGYEYGFTRPLDVVRTRPEDWEEPKVDLTGFVAEVNAMKASVPVLNAEGPQRRVSAPQAPVVGLCRWGGDGEDAALILINPDERGAHAVEPGPLLAATGGVFDGFRDVTPEAEARPLEPGTPLELAPLELRVFRGSRAEGQAVVEVRSDAYREADRALLERLAGSRVAIESVQPELDGGRFAVKREVGDVVEVVADVFADGHEKINACIKVRFAGAEGELEYPMAFVDNDRWAGQFPLTRNGRWSFRVEAWRDLFEHWRADFIKKRDAGQNIGLELIEGRALVEKSVQCSREPGAREVLGRHLEAVKAAGDDEQSLQHALLDDRLHEDMRRLGERVNLTAYKELEVFADRTAARFAAWYELFPRSMSDDPNRHGTFDDVIAKLPYVRSMGFDVLYFTPIHPIGRTFRKGRNNTLEAGPDDVGSPYAIGSEEGGHTGVHPQLGTIEDFDRLVAAARDQGLEIALDFAIQCSPDHPWIKEHPDWFDWRPDGSIKYAENPPKKYQDIVNVHFYRHALPEIWYALRDVVLFWVEHGVKIFRVDNPHTKPLPFWEWLIRSVQDAHPDVIFLAEAFTRPKLMKRLAKLGFTQSYSYFTWRNHKAELIEYFTELTQQEPREYMRANLFPNTPDILPPVLQTGGRAAFMMRAVMATTLSSVYGMYSGFELCEGRPLPGKEEYLDSEKFELKAWDWDRPGNIRGYIARLNAIRRANPALQEYDNLRFYNAWDDNILYYGKMTASKDNFVLVAVNLDPHNPHGAHFEVPLWEFGLPDHARVDVEDLFTGARFSWYGKVQQMWLDPRQNPAAIWRIALPGLAQRF
ncbi:maltotransferase domain-containing protein [Arenibaculum pallidiluteum]|uniref:maltotransferase domain-containing protein n=1 Tax=Arenibaculum pallidiluteum TaxID=2812559 RepID=UPI002E2A2A2E|nr:maltotransferase domain-containing protein [Arenibaculum pallidiluteum]